MFGSMKRVIVLIVSAALALALPDPRAQGYAQTSNLALNRPATASSVEAAGLEAAKAVDGNASTRWSSQFSDPQWIMVDLGTTYAVGRVRLTWEGAYAKAYRVEVSSDAST